MSIEKKAREFRRGFLAAGVLLGLSFVGFFASIKYTESLQREHWRKKRDIMRQREAERNQ
ncbi:unnamed protein product [Hymenolepis diminuta]|uniref:Uncharacterized protein n=1 Tax=Hymenolepis diminuta TaxID=6216 RepID=A0A564Y1R5_HYMDI|nr:unnamed protein product [Hymenolepis diminuta]